MGKPTAREVSLRVLERVTDHGAYLSLALAAELERAQLPAQDRGLATELSYGVVRHRSRLDRALLACADRGLQKLDSPALEVLRMAAYEILFLRIPDYAAVDEAVGLIHKIRGRSLGGFANALLRRLAREREPLPPDDPTERLLVLESCPHWIYEEYVSLLGEAEAQALVKAQNEPAWQGVRASRVPREEVAQRIAVERPGAEIRDSPLVPSGLLVRQGGALHETETYRSGLFTLQDPAAQLAALLVEPRPGERILDACAGVGGKATYLAELAQDQAKVDAVDVSAQKLELLGEHARRLGVRSIRPVLHDLLSLPAEFGGYDRALVDVPCMGLGTLRRHPERKWTARRQEVPRLAELAQGLLERVAERVRPGGVLVFSVCSLTVMEGPAQITEFLGSHPDWRRDLEPRLTLPHRDGADGFYIARLKRSTHS